jgi:peroxiredoxin
MVPVEELDGYSRRSLVLKLGGATLAVAALLVFWLRPARPQQAPDFELPLLSGRGTLSSRELEGSVVVLNFFASWCAPCRQEAPRFEAAWQRYRDQGVEFVGVNLRDRPATARHFVEEFGISFPIVVDDDEELATKLGVYGLPQTFFIGRDWELAGTQTGDELGEQKGTTRFGAIESKELNRRVQALLDEEPR